MFLPDRGANEEWLGVVIAVPEPWVSQITEARLALGDKVAAKVPAHITIMPPIAVSSHQREEVFEHLRGLAKVHQPFRVKIDGTGTFMPTSPVVFLKITEGARDCAALAEDIRSGPLDYPLRFPYHPHVTIGHDLPETTLNLALEMGKNFQASWMVRGFRLDRVGEDGSYTSAALFDFSS